LITVVAAGISCIVAIVALATARSAHSFVRGLEVTRRRREHAQWALALAPRLQAALGGPEDGIEPNVRLVLVELLEGANAIWRDGQLGLVSEDWDGHRAPFEEWMRRPEAQFAWPKLRDRWELGFRTYVDAICHDT
jgi:hypothetical protein